MTGTDLVGVLCEQLQRAMDDLGKHPEYDTRRDMLRWDKLDDLLTHLLDDNGKPATDTGALVVARALLGLDGEDTEWCVFWGGPDPDSADEVVIRDDRQDAEWFARCLDLSAGGGVASRWDPLESTCRHASLSIL